MKTKTKYSYYRHAANYCFGNPGGPPFLIRRDNKTGEFETVHYNIKRIDGIWQKADIRGQKIFEHDIIRREILVLELPPIPEGFRPVTKEDINNKTKGEFKLLLFGENPRWERIESDGANNIDIGEYICIIKPKQKGFTIKDVAPGMPFYLGNIPYEVSHFEVNGCIALRDFGGITIEILNKHFSYSDFGKIIPCSEYQG